MTEVAVRDDNTAEPGRPSGRAGTDVASLVDWAEEARAAYQLAATLCKTSFVPSHFRGKPEETTAAILTGREMGVSPMGALRSIYMIQGTPSMYAHAMRAVVQSHGHSIWEEETSPTRVVVRGHRKGEPDRIRESVWTIERARTAGLLSNQQYARNPQNMLTARATAEVCRLVAADALLGIPYATEELQTEPERIRATVEPAPRVTAAEILGTPEPAPPVDGSPADADDWPTTAQPGGTDE